MSLVNEKSQEMDNLLRLPVLTLQRQYHTLQHAYRPAQLVSLVTHDTTTEIPVTEGTVDGGVITPAAGSGTETDARIGVPAAVCN